MPDQPTLTKEPQGTVTATKTEREFTVKERSQWKMAYKRFLRHRVATVSVFIFVLLILFAFVMTPSWKQSHTDLTPDFNEGPSWKHPFGTDNLGFDQFAVVMRGTAQSLKVAFMIGIFGTTVGAIWGVVSGF